MNQERFVEVLGVNIYTVVMAVDKKFDPIGSPRVVSIPFRTRSTSVHICSNPFLEHIRIVAVFQAELLHAVPCLDSIGVVIFIVFVNVDLEADLESAVIIPGIDRIARFTANFDINFLIFFAGGPEIGRSFNPWQTIVIRRHVIKYFLPMAGVYFEIVCQQ